MSYMALYRRWRPKDFTDVVGQKQVSDTLMRAIREDKVAHAYLFAGPRGTGKTSIAKIFARAINCEQGPTDHPCNECASCRQILEGRSMDVLEIDAASNRGIDEVRALRESAKFMPVEGRKKIFIIDEAHMLTNEAWNALLKTIEEPPAHIMFIFATTEPEKIPVTILSRCQRYTFRRITAQDIAEHLLCVAAGSGIKLDSRAAQLIAIHADGGLRDALSILDQCSGMTDDTITVEHVETMIGLVSKQWVIHMFSCLRSGDGASMLTDIQQALDEGRDSKQMVTALIEHLRSLLIAKVMPEAEELRIYDAFREAFTAQAEAVSAEEINRYVRSLQSIQNDAKRVDNPRTVIEVGLLALAARAGVGDGDTEERLAALEFRLDGEDDGVKTRLAKLEAAVKDGVGQGPAMTAPLPAEATAVTDAVRGSMPPAPARKADPMPAMMHSPSLPPKRPAKGAVPPPKSGASTDTDTATAVPPSSPYSTLGTTASGTDAVIGEGILPATEYRGIQGRVLQWMQGKKMLMTAGFYRMGQLIYVDAVRAVVAFNTDFNVRMATTDKVINEVTTAFANVLGRPMTVTVVGSNTPEDKAYRAAAHGAGGVSKAVAPSTAPPPAATVPIAGDRHEQQQPALPKGKEVPASTAVQRSDLPEEIDDFGSSALAEAEAPAAVASTADSVDITKLPKWDPAHCRDEERANPVLYGALAQAAADGNDIYVEVVDDDQEDT